MLHSSQCGNLLVLAACSQHPVLKQYVDKDELRTSFQRTTRLLDTLIERRKTALATDKRILEAVSGEIFSNDGNGAVLPMPTQLTVTGRATGIVRIGSS